MAFQLKQQVTQQLLEHLQLDNQPFCCVQLTLEMLQQSCTLSAAIVEQNRFSNNFATMTPITDAICAGRKGIASYGTAWISTYEKKPQFWKEPCKQLKQLHQTADAN